MNIRIIEYSQDHSSNDSIESLRTEEPQKLMSNQVVSKFLKPQNHFHSNEILLKASVNTEEGKLFILLHAKVVPPNSQASQAEFQTYLDHALHFIYNQVQGDYVTCPRSESQLEAKVGWSPSYLVSFSPSPAGHVDSP